MNYTTYSPDETKNVAGKIFKKFSEQKREGALVFALGGELGTGKTKFTQGVAKFLGIKRNITSPTFVLMKHYYFGKNLLTRKKKLISMCYFESLYHLDCYRLYSSKELLDLEWTKIISNPKNIVFVEWAEKIKDILPLNTIYVTIKDKGDDKREIDVYFENINNAMSSKKSLR